jgi:uncharacterized protein Yka (UPF0111/DUF47 family)
VLDKYFGLLNIQDEFSVVDSLLDYVRIDNEELILLERMISAICSETPQNIEEFYDQIRIINKESKRKFENIAQNIVQAQFNQQKKYDLLRLFQRTELIPELIIASAKRGLILYQIGGKIPLEIHNELTNLMKRVREIHNIFEEALDEYKKDKKNVLEKVCIIEEIEHDIDRIRALNLKTLYQLGNENKVLAGDLHAIENIIEHLEDTADVIKDAATSLEWLLIY